MTDTATVLLPASRAEAVRMFGDGRDTTVLGGGTVVVPDIASGRLRPSRALLLHRADLAHVDGDRTLTLGAMVSVAELAASAPEPLRSAARGVADPEVRAQATLGGNICVPPGATSPRGDLQAPLVALAARVRSAGAGGERVEPLEHVLETGAGGRLVLDIEFEVPARGAYTALHRSHTHGYTALSVAAVDDGARLRLAAGGVGAHAVRLHAVEAALARGDAPEAVAAAAHDDLQMSDDALASAWYRRRMLPVLVTRVLRELEGA